MKRFITYVYVYENGIKGKNAGFIKAEIRDGKIRMEMQLRNLGRYQGRAGIDLIVPEPNNNAGMRLPFGKVEFHHGIANASLEDDEAHIAGSNYDFSQVVGVRMDLDETHYLASCWVEHAEQYMLHPGRNKTDDGPSQKKAATIVQKVERKILEERRQEEKQSQEQQPQERQPQEQQPQEQQPQEKQPQEQQPQEKQPQSTEVRRIDISDIHKFPKQNWYLCNNSFLIHGFFNYHYLVVKKITEDAQNKYYLGVPGVYDKPERMMALLFGFPEFEPAQQEKSKETASENFGYWYCLLDM